MNQEQMDALRLVIVTALASHSRVDYASMAGTDEGDQVFATIGDFDVVLTVEPV